jgi:hypothetical protein
MDVLRTIFIVLAYLLWIFGLVFLVSSVVSGGTAFMIALALGVLGSIFFGLNKFTKRR